MICDCEKTIIFSKYLALKGPYVITFYKEDLNRKNFFLYSRLKDLEKEYNDIPIIRFDYVNLTKMYSSIKIPSPNHVLLIELFQCKKIFDNPTKDTILGNLQKGTGKTTFTEENT